MGRWSRSLALTRMSFQVIKKDKSMLLFPLISGIVTLIAMASFFGTWLFVNGFNWEVVQGSPITYALVFLLYLIAYFVAIFFNVALVACSMRRLEGGEASVRYGLGYAAGRAATIFKWAIVAATVGLVLRALSEKAGAVGQVILGLVGVAWSIATYFVVPVIAFEGIGPFKAIQRSAGLLKGAWGEAFLSNLSIGLIFFLLGIVGLLPIAAAYLLTANMMVLLAAVAAAVVYWIILGMLSSTASAVLCTALYRYAATGRMPEGFPENAIRNPWSLGQ